MGVTVQQAQTAMANLLARAAAESWVPNKILPTLSYMGAETIEKLKKLRPYGVSDGGNIRRVSSQEM